MAYLSMPSPDIYRTAIRSGLAIWYTVNASYGGSPVAGATGMQPTGGSITDTSKLGVRRTLRLDLAPEPGLFDLLSPIGTTLTVTAHVRYADRTVIDIPMGVFDVDSETLSEGGGALSLTAPDKWVRIQRAKFTGPTASVAGRLVTDEIIDRIQGALGIFEPVSVLATSTARVPALVWEKDRDKAIQELATSIGASVFFDRNGLCTIADLPTVGASADWLIDSSASGVLTALDRERSRTNTYNVVVVSSSAADGEKFPPQVRWDSDPYSPTYAGVDPIAHPDLAGPFGVATYFYDTPVVDTALGAQFAGDAILARTVGLASQVSLGSVPNPAVDATDTLDVMPPGHTRLAVVGYRGGAGFGVGPFGTMEFGGGVPGAPIIDYVSEGAFLERHMADTVQHPLTVGAEQHIDGRSTRADEYAG